MQGTKALFLMSERSQAFVSCVHQSLASLRLPSSRVGEGITPRYVFPGWWLASAENNSLAKQAGVSHWQPTLTPIEEGYTCPG